MIYPAFSLAAAFALACLPALANQTAAKPTVQCGNGIVTAQAYTQAQAQLVCRHSDAALARFSACALPAPPPLHIETVAGLDTNCVGIFHCGEDRIEVLAPEALAEARNKLGLLAHLSSERLFESVILHEMAHALYDRTPCPYEHCVASSEYFAYTQQIAALSPDERAPIEAQGPTGRPVHRDSLNVIILMMAPDRFARMAWAHFKTRPDPCAQWQGVLSGAILFDRHHP